MMDPYVRDQYRLRQNPFGPMGSHPGHSQGIPPNLPHALGFPPGLTPGAVMPGGLPQAWGGLKAEAEREERERKDKEQQQLERYDYYQKYLLNHYTSSTYVIIKVKDILDYRCLYIQYRFVDNL